MLTSARCVETVLSDDPGTDDDDDNDKDEDWVPQDSDEVEVEGGDDPDSGGDDSPEDKEVNKKSLHRIAAEKRFTIKILTGKGLVFSKTVAAKDVNCWSSSRRTG